MSSVYSLLSLYIWAFSEYVYLFNFREWNLTSQKFCIFSYHLHLSFRCFCDEILTRIWSVAGRGTGSVNATLMLYSVCLSVSFCFVCLKLPNLEEKRSTGNGRRKERVHLARTNLIYLLNFLTMKAVLFQNLIPL